jgi:hypothetical protein
MQHEVAAHARVKRANHTVGGAVTAQAAPTELEVWFTENRILLENYYLPGDLFQTWPDNPAAERKDQTPDYPSTPVAAPIVLPAKGVVLLRILETIGPAPMEYRRV